MYIRGIVGHQSRRRWFEESMEKVGDVAGLGCKISGTEPHGEISTNFRL
jgi:hypothetical protein